ncbi:MAG: helix-turn-helix domain-containing protein [Bacteroidota bacterium]
MACLHGLLLASILFFSKRLRSRANQLLALVLFEICIILSYELAYQLEFENEIPTLISYAPLYIRTIIPIGLYFFVIFLMEPEHKITSREKILFIVVALEFLIELLYIPVNLVINDEIQVANFEDYIEISGQGLGLLTSVILLPITLRKINRYQQFLYNNYSTTQEKSLSWLRNFLIAAMLIIALWLVSFVQYLAGWYEAADQMFILVSFCLVIFLFAVGYFVILRYSWFEIIPIKIQDSAEVKLSSKTDTYHEHLKALMQEKRLYEDINLTLDSLAEKLQISSGYLSQIINTKEQKNFFEFVNEYRVEAVKAKLLNQEYDQYTIMGIALESGFKSKSTFNAVFKKFTGLTPSAFKKTQQRVRIT